MRNRLVESFAAALTLRRIQVHAALIVIALWSVFLWDYSTPGLLDRNGLLKGTDFLHFYTIGTLAREGREAQLYDLEAQMKLAGERVPAAKGMVYVPFYGPQVALLFAPLAALSYGKALVVWLLVNAVLYAVCCWLVWRQCPALRDKPCMIALAALAFPAFFHLLTWGQTSGLALLCFTLMFLALSGGNKFAAGLAFGLLFFKPQLGLAGCVIFLLAGEWLILAGAALTAAAQLAIAWLYFGSAVLCGWFFHLYNAPAVLHLLEPKPYQLHSLRGFWDLLVPERRIAAALYLISAVVVLALAFRTWQRARSLDLRFSALLLATVLVAPHLTIYDLVILAPAFLMLANWTIRDGAPAVRVLLYLCFVLPLIGPLARWTHVQVTVIATAMLLCWVEKRCSATDDADALQTGS
jgi:alpha-1,2-mannosyltransferase